MIYHTSDDGPPAYSEGTAVGSFRDLDAAVLRAVRRIERFTGPKFDMIVVQGVSGMSLGFPLALKLGMDIVVVRKDGDENHCGKERIITGSSVTGKKLLFVDDFISGGTTRQRVRTAVEAEGGKVVGEYTSRENTLTKA